MIHRVRQFIELNQLKSESWSSARINVDMSCFLLMRLFKPSQLCLHQQPSHLLFGWFCYCKTENGLWQPWDVVLYQFIEIVKAIDVRDLIKLFVFRTDIHFTTEICRCQKNALHGMQKHPEYRAKWWLSEYFHFIHDIINEILWWLHESQQTLRKNFKIYNAESTLSNVNIFPRQRVFSKLYIKMLISLILV